MYTLWLNYCWSGKNKSNALWWCHVGSFGYLYYYETAAVNEGQFYYRFCRADLSDVTVSTNNRLPNHFDKSKLLFMLRWPLQQMAGSLRLKSVHSNKKKTSIKKQFLNFRGFGNIVQTVIAVIAVYARKGRIASSSTARPDRFRGWSRFCWVFCPT